MTTTGSSPNWRSGSSSADGTNPHNAHEAASWRGRLPFASVAEFLEVSTVIRTPDAYAKALVRLALNRP
jgi:hypothetical protein